MSIESPMTVYFCSNARALVAQLVSDRKFQRPRLGSWLDLTVIFLNTGPIASSIRLHMTDTVICDLLIGIA